MNFNSKVKHAQNVVKSLNSQNMKTFTSLFDFLNQLSEIQELKETLRSFEGGESAAIDIVLSDNEFDSSVKDDYLDAIKDAEATDDKQLFVVIHRLGMTDLISSLWGEVVDDVKKTYACEANKILDSLEEAFKENGVKKDSLTLKNSSN